MFFIFCLLYSPHYDRLQTREYLGQPVQFAAVKLLSKNLESTAVGVQASHRLFQHPVTGRLTRRSRALRAIEQTFDGLIPSASRFALF